LLESAASRPLKLFVQQSFKSRRIDYVKRLFFTGEKLESERFHTRDDKERLVMGESLRPYVFEAEIDHEAQAPDLPVLFPEIVVHGSTLSIRSFSLIFSAS
jgi:hypothetical protein